MAITIGIVALLLTLAYVFSPKPAPPIHFKKTGEKTNAPSNWKGIPVDAKGRYINISFPYYHNYLKIFFWFPSHLFSKIKNIGKQFSVQKHSDDSFLSNDNTVIWLGHASFFMRINGVNFLIDPQFHNTSLYMRHTANPIPSEYFKNIDCLLLSHDHADHCDLRSLKQIFRQNPSLTVITGLGMEKILKKPALPTVTIHTAGWYDVFNIKGLKICFVPSRHYCKRLDNKFNENLWGGFVIQPLRPESKSIYFAGDSGYDESHFKTIKQLFSPAVAMLGIGACAPYYFMHPNHTGPGEALQAFKDCGASLMIPMHHSTFFLGNERAEEPVETLKTQGKDENIAFVKPGETIHLASLLFPS